MTETTGIVLAARPTGEPTHENFRTETVPLPALADGQVLLQTRYRPRRRGPRAWA